MTRSGRRSIYCLILWFAFLLTTSVCHAQDEFLLNEHFEETPFRQFVSLIEGKSSYQFFFDEEELDSLLISETFKNSSLDEALATIFTDSRFHVLIHNNNVFITKDRPIHAHIPDSYIAQTEAKNEEEFDIRLFDFLNESSSQQNGDENDITEIGQLSEIVQGGKATITGKVINHYTGEAIIGAVVQHPPTNTGVSTDVLGNYHINIPTGRSYLEISSVGMNERHIEILLYGDGTLEINLKEEVKALKEVVIEASRDENIEATQMGVEKLDINSISQLPTLMGEVDVLKAIQTLPGVQSSGENSTGLNVRGGSTGQNLILFNDAPIYNPSHLFGFFSVFNPEVVKDIELYKSGIPARYGGRLSSVLTVNSKNGNKKRLAASGGIGLVSGRLLLEGPIIEDKLTFLVSGRSTYSNWLVSQIQNDNIRKSRGSFYDLHAKMIYEKDNKNSITLSAYYSDDKFQLQSDTTYQYNNFSTNLKWKHIFNKSLYGEFTGGFTEYKYNIAFDGNPVYAFDSDYQTNQGMLKADFNFEKSKHTFSFGVNADFYRIHPVSQVSTGEESVVEDNITTPEQAIETAIYIGDQLAISERVSLYGALRYSFYQFLGPGTVNQYESGIPKSPSSLINTISYGKNEVIASYGGPEFRASARYLIDTRTSVKLSYQRMRQYIHMLSNTTTISPTDIWKLSDTYILPEIGDQFSIGFYKNLRANSIETSVEAYYKTMDNILDYKNGAQLLLNRNIETDIIGTDGRAYGVEFLVKKVVGKFNGWLSYTYSRSLLQTKASVGGESINLGKEYPSTYDRPHDVTLVSNYKISRRLNFSLNFTYSTGRPTTLPTGKYDYYEVERLVFSERNQYRIPDYYRTDVSINFEGNHKIKKLAHSSWSVSVYNVTGRDNAYSVFYTNENGRVKGYQLSIFNQPIPTITYNFRF